MTDLEVEINDLKDYISEVDEKQANNAVKIAELEKTLEANLAARLPDADWLTVNTNFIKIKSEIGKLEEKVEERGEEYKIYNTYADMEKEISEIKMDNMLKFNVIENHSTILMDMEKQIKELKEQIGRYNKNFTGFSELKGIVLEERQRGATRHDVLREFISLYEMSKMIDTGLLPRLEGEKLNPHLKCDGECYDCDDNIPSHGSTPHQCGRKPDSKPSVRSAAHTVWCSLEEQEFCAEEGSLDCIPNKNTCIHGKKNIEIDRKPSEPITGSASARESLDRQTVKTYYKHTDGRLHRGYVIKCVECGEEFSNRDILPTHNLVAKDDLKWIFKQISIIDDEGSDGVNFIEIEKMEKKYLSEEDTK